MDEDIITELRALEAKASDGPWGWNSYSAICSPDNGHAEWQGARLDEGHTLEGRVGADECPACGPWTWDYTNPRTGEVTTYDGNGCRLYTEDYHRDPYVASVPAHHGDTATGRHAADAALIEAMRNALPELLDAAAQRDRYRLAWQSARQRAQRGKVKFSLLRATCRAWATMHRDAETQRDRLREQIAALADLWREQRLEYPLDDPRASAAFVAVKACEAELRALLDTLATEEWRP